MALILKHQTASAFAARFWERVSVVQNTDKVEFARLVRWLLQRIAAGDITDTQARTSFNTAFNRSLTSTQWNTLKANRLQPLADRYTAMLAEAEL